MARHRLIPIILIKNGQVVRSQLFRIHQIIGNPIHTIRRLSNWNVDELILLDIGKDDVHDMRRDDLHVRYSSSSLTELLGQISEVCFMPLAVGGRIRSLEDISARLSAGADKCVLNTAAVQTPSLITDAAQRFGDQCVVVSIDALRHPDGRLEAFVEGGRTATGLTPADLAKRCADLGAGEILINSIDRDGSGWGYDIDLIRSVAAAVDVPVIAAGGVGFFEHLPPAIADAGADAAAAANIFHFTELSYPRAKDVCITAGLDMRPLSLGSRWFPREPVYDTAREDALIETRLERARRNAGPDIPSGYTPPPMQWCSKCLYPFISATPMEFGDDGKCMGCRMSEMKVNFSREEWARREQMLVDIIESTRCPHGSRPDCIIPVSGGKDSYFQAHYIRNVLGYKPLLVTYYGNNYSEVGQRNLLRMKEAFDCDHIIYQPSVSVLKKLNRLGFIVMGDMNWHNHIGISTIPMRVAVQTGIPTVIWGEHGYADLCGQFSMNDFVEWSYRNRLEHAGRGYEWNYFVGREGLTAVDLLPYRYPSDEEIFALGLRGLHLSNYVLWEANAHTALVRERYGFEVSDEPFERTYRTMSNLDDIHENGVHDYLKFVKLGYGRCTDHTSKDIRAGIMSRDQGLDLVRERDPIKPKDLQRWLAYVGMSEEEFDAIADTFRDKRVWRRDDDGAFVRDAPWGGTQGAGTGPTAATSTRRSSEPVTAP